MAASQNEDLEQLLQFLKEDHGFDFSGYKRGTLARRINRRMHEVGIENHRQYIMYLQSHPEEFTLLFTMILINVTEFFRDADACDYLEREIIPRILKGKSDSDPIRVWSAGCASGEEAYTIAMILCDRLGEEEFKQRVKIYATDVDDDALRRARHAVYSEASVSSLPRDFKTRFFEHINGDYSFRTDIRRAVIFGRNDLIQDAPISRIDLLICRNTFMYFNASTQARILARFHFALENSGFLFLGKAEMLVSHSRLFTPLDPKWRVFTKVGHLSMRERFTVMSEGRVFRSNQQGDESIRLREEAFDRGPNAQMVVDRRGSILLLNAQARSELGLNTNVVGTPIRDLQLSYRPFDLRSLIDDVMESHQPKETKPMPWPDEEGAERYVKMVAQPLGDGGTSHAGVILSFVDVTEAAKLQFNLEHANQELETAYEELQSANEELETTNEELNSTVEELETTNEELQSTNEELETMNEELQSTNEELETINVELQVRTAELNAANLMMESILSRSMIGVIVVDQDLRVMVWNRRTEDMWGLRANEVHGQYLLNLDIGLPVSELRQPMRSCLTDPEARVQLTLKALNRRGRTVQCRITCDPLVREGQQIDGVILWVEEQPILNQSDTLTAEPEVTE